MEDTSLLKSLRNLELNLPALAHVSHPLAPSMPRVGASGEASLSPDSETTNHDHQLCSETSVFIGDSQERAMVDIMITMFPRCSIKGDKSTLSPVRLSG